jgi:Ca-activated chloride channel family protein
MGSLVTEESSQRSRTGFSSLIHRATQVFLVFVVVMTLAVGAHSQSGRKKENQTTKHPSGPVAEPTRPRTVTDKTPQSKTTSDVDPSDVVRISSHLVPIPVSVIDQLGNAITNLKLDQFELQVDGQPRPLSDLTRTDTPVRLVMLFDNSGSLDQEREFEKQAAMRFFRRVLRPVDEAAIYSIETDSRLAQPLTNNIPLLEQTIANFGRPSGGTSLLDAIAGASNYLRPYVGRRVLVIVSDGIETTSQITDFEDAVKNVLARDCQVFVVQTGLYEGANLRALAAERRMERLSGQTGGAVFLPKTVAELDVAFNQIAADLAQQYVLSYYPAPEHRDGRLHVIDLKVKSRNDVRVRSRKGYYAPKAASSEEW